MRENERVIIEKRERKKVAGVGLLWNGRVLIETL